MLSEETIIQTDGGLGDINGGNGYLGLRRFVADSEHLKGLGEALLEGTCLHNIITKSEFTYCPDNPMYEYNCIKRLYLNSSGIVIKEAEKKHIYSDINVSNLPENGI